jgi:hypothetical protein
VDEKASAALALSRRLGRQPLNCMPIFNLWIFKEGVL